MNSIKGKKSARGPTLHNTGGRSTFTRLLCLSHRRSHLHPLAVDDLGHLAGQITYLRHDIRQILHSLLLSVVHLCPDLLGDVGPQRECLGAVINSFDVLQAEVHNASTGYFHLLGDIPAHVVLVKFEKYI